MNSLVLFAPYLREVGNGGSCIELLEGVICTLFALFGLLRDHAGLVPDISEVDRAGRTRLLTGRYDRAVCDVLSRILRRLSSRRDPM